MFRQLRPIYFYLIILLCGCESDPSRQTARESFPPISIVASSPAVSFADSVMEKIQSFLEHHEYDSALVHSKKAGEGFAAEGDWAGYVRAKSRQALAHLRKNEFSRAQEILEYARQTGVEKLGENHIGLAPVYDVFGRLYFNRGDPDQALAYFQKKLATLQAIPGTPNPKAVAGSYQSIAAAYQRKGAYNRTLDALNQALNSWSMYNPKLDDWQTGDIFFSFGNLHIHRGEYDLAEEYYLKTLGIWRAVLGDSLKEWQTANLYNNLGIIYNKKHRFVQALESYKQSLNVCRELFGENHPIVALRYNNLGNTYLAMNDFDQAEAYHQKALNIRLAKLGDRHPTIGYSYANLGSVHAKKGDRQQALASYEKSLALLKAVRGRRHPDVAQCYILIGDVYFENEKYGQALRMYQNALQANVPDFNNDDPAVNPPLEDAFSAERLLAALQKKAKTFARRAEHSHNPVSNLRASLSTSELAIQAIDRLRRGYKAEGAKLFLSENAVETFELAIETANALYRATGKSDYLKEAFTFAERSRAGILLDAMLESEAKQFAGIPDTLLETERQQRLDLAACGNALDREQLKGRVANRMKIDSLQSRLFDLKRGQETILARFEMDYPDYYNLKYREQIVTLKEIQDKLLDDSTALIEYFLGTDSLFIFTVTKDEMSITSVSTDTLLKQQVAQLRSGIMDQNYEQYTRVAHWLYQVLLYQVGKNITAQNLIIVPDGVLSYIPFEALLTGVVHSEGIKDYRTLPFLLKKHTVSYAYSATLLLETMQRKQDQNFEHNYLAYAPVFRDRITNKGREGDFIQAHEKVDSTLSIAAEYLPASKEEVMGVQRLFTERAGFWDKLFGAKTKVYVDEKATEANLKSGEAGHYRFVHFATHAIFNESRPKLSGLILAQNNSKSEDNILYLSEIYNLNLNSELVVLSACETGLGKIAKGEGLIGLARGFLYAGASNLLVSLWQVNDVSTANLMHSFYKTVLDGEGNTSALRKAKLHLIAEQSKYARPYYWAPFVLIGK